ncbi:MAG: putative porin [Chthoniobacter sp.]|uniref:putative porin n=1 Tax=Chthoniobacter sp. TaxID=2510640 RepID=UPI0032AD53E7
MHSKYTLKLAAALAAIGCTAAPLHAQDAGALVDKLIKKGILTDQEGEEVRADMMKDFSQTNAGKINLSNSVTALKLYGDLRMRWTYTDTQAQVPDGNDVNQRSRWQYRLRLNADINLGPDWFAGIQLQTGQTPDSGNQTFSGGFNNDSIFISRAYLGWQNDWLRIVAGKQANPFYTTDLVWDPDIQPAGLTEKISFHKMPLFGGSGGPSGDGKGVAEPSRDNPWEVSLIGGQFIFGDNNEFANTSNLNSDPWIFQEQLVATYKFNKDTSVTVAPSFLAENAAHMTGTINKLPFSDEGAISSGTTAVQTTVQEVDNVAISYNAAGVPTKTITPLTTTTTTQTTITPNNKTSGAATVSGPRKISATASSSRNGGVITLVGSKASGVATDPSKANQTFTSTATRQNQTVSTTNNVTLPAVNGETRALHILTAPGDISFKIGGLKSKLYWDFAYNVSGRNRFDNVYQLKDFGSRPYKARDSIAWLVGFQLGETKKKGDWVAYLNYRETGIASVDPNLNDDDSAQSALNMRGFKLGIGYAITDFVVINATGYMFWNLDQGLSGGRATSVGGIAPYNTSNTVQLDFNIKF